ncbi:hypothetical protein [Sporosarcina highlanderae]|uniref:Uncharacterized protein n=1 Tax=Sporosarcina highlanderae TaxID=3035916 RepID=A0ABT8JSB2_9BACL|nr:hypothetical protein [Sporosarcina highlanderae]MDN4607034.1 hypothetical protein [Sporosarcina highlanderae]
MAQSVEQVEHIAEQSLKSGWPFACMLPFWKYSFLALVAWMVQTDFPLETPEKVVSATGRSMVSVVDRTSVAYRRTAKTVRAQMDRMIRISWITPFIWSI